MLTHLFSILQLVRQGTMKAYYNQFNYNRCCFEMSSTTLFMLSLNSVPKPLKYMRN